MAIVIIVILLSLAVMSLFLLLKNERRRFVSNVLVVQNVLHSVFIL